LVTISQANVSTLALNYGRQNEAFTLQEGKTMKISEIPTERTHWFALALYLGALVALVMALH